IGPSKLRSLKSTSWKRQKFAVKCTLLPPTPWTYSAAGRPGTSATFDSSSRNVCWSTGGPPPRSSCRNVTEISSCVKSAAVRNGPCSRTTTSKPALESSFARMPPEDPEPTMTKSTGLALSKCTWPSAAIALALHVLGVVVAERRLVPAVLAIEPQQFPPDVVLIAAVGAHAEETRERQEADEVEEAGIFLRLKIRVLVVLVEIGKALRTGEQLRYARLEFLEPVSCHAELAFHDGAE